jgi:hypothetical protein
VIEEELRDEHERVCKLYDQKYRELLDIIKKTHEISTELNTLGNKRTELAWLISK